MQNIQKIIGKTIVIRKAEPKDVEAIFRNVWSDVEVIRTTFLYQSPDLEEAKARLERTFNYQKDKYMFFMALKDTDEAIGLCGILPVEESVYQEGGFIIGKNFQRKGYGTEMLNIFLDIVFTKLNAKEFIYSYCDGNDKSRHLANRFGFTYFETDTEIRGWDKKEFKIHKLKLKKDDYKGINFEYEIQ